MKKIYSIKEGEMPSTSKPTIGEFFLTLLHAATNGHILHLQTKSYSEHKAMQKYYEELPDLVDRIIEEWQGAYQIIVEYPNTYQAPSSDSLTEVTMIRDYLVANRDVVGPYTSLQNDVDELMSLLDSTIYKLTFLD
jgi:hypothetical protein